MSKRLKIVHVTSAHRDGDVRIFKKECVSLAKAGFEVYHLVPNSTSRTESGVQVVSFPFPVSSRFKRMFFLVKEVGRRALQLDADIYHLHDPELLRIAGKLKKAGKKVIYDAHEDVPRDIMTKDYIPRWLRKTVSRRFEKFENRVVAGLDGIVAATPFIRDRFLKINPHSIDINNYPLADEINVDADETARRGNKVCYIGILSRIRGLRQMVEGAATAGVPLMLAGDYRDHIRAEVSALAGWTNTTELGLISRQQALDLKRTCIAGLVIFHPVANHIDAQPNKIFEYMSAGLPVIGSHFPLWKKIIEDGNCGICVDPFSPAEIAAAIKQLAADPELVRQMGDNGKRLVQEHYNWDIEQQKLVDFYKRISD